MEKNAANNSASTKNSPPPNSPPHTPTTDELDTTIETNPTNEPSEKITNETNPTDEASEKIMKTVEEVMADLSSDDDDDDDDDEIGEHWRDGREDDWDTDEEDEGEDGHVSKKRKLTHVRDAPAGKPTCPECKKEFATWKAVFGHMRQHPGRAHRGFFPPPSFTPTAPVAGIHDAEDDEDNNVGEGVDAVVREIVTDLNRSIGAPAESSADGSGGSGGNLALVGEIVIDLNRPIGAPAWSSADRSGGSGGNQAAPPPADNEEGGRFREFDLNEMPPADDEAEEK